MAPGAIEFDTPALGAPAYKAHDQFMRKKKNLNCALWSVKYGNHDSVYNQPIYYHQPRNPCGPQYLCNIPNELRKA